jgi:hypothetical protein
VKHVCARSCYHDMRYFCRSRSTSTIMDRSFSLKISMVLATSLLGTVYDRTYFELEN